jgi:hypothetical protein
MTTFFPTDDNDFALVPSKRGKLTLSLERDEVIAGAIKLRARFQLWEGEWFLDTRVGVPYRRMVLVKSPDLPVITRMFRRVILSVPVIATVAKLLMGYDPAQRKASMDFEAFASDGRKVSGGPGKPFIVDNRDLSDYIKDRGAKLL